MIDGSFELSGFEHVDAIPGTALLRVAARSTVASTRFTLLINGIVRIQPIPAPPGPPGVLSIAFAIPAEMAAAAAMYLLEIDGRALIDLPVPRRRRMPLRAPVQDAAPTQVPAAVAIAELPAAGIRSPATAAPLAADAVAAGARTHLSPGRGAAFRKHLSDPLYRTGYFLTISSGVSALLGFAFWSLAAHRYSVRELGINSSAIAAMTFVSGFSQFGLGGVLVRFVPAGGPGTRRVVMRVYGATAAASVVLAAGAALTSPLWSSSLGRLAHDPWWCVSFILATALWTVFTLQDVVLTGLRASHVVPLENISYAVAKLALLLGLSAVAPTSGPFIAWNAPGAVGVVVISWIIFGRLMPGRARPDGSAARGARGLDASTGRTIRAAVAANIIGGLFIQITSFLTPVIVIALLGPTQEAYLYAPWTILLALNAITVATMSSLTVEGVRDPANANGLARRALLQTLAMLTPLLLILLLGAPLILHLYGAAYARAGTGLMRLLALSLIPSSVSSIGLGLARVQRRYRVVTAILALPSILQFTLTVALLHAIGISAAGWAQLAADSSAAVVLALTLMRPVFRRNR